MRQLVLLLSFCVSLVIHSFLYIQISSDFSKAKYSAKVSIVVTSQEKKIYSVKKELRQKKREQAPTQTKEKVSFKENITKASSQFKIVPNYPYLSKANKEEGQVVVEVIIEANGSLKSAKILKSSGYKRLDNEAIRSIRNTSFHPTKENNVTKEDKIKLTITFNLTD